MPAILTLNKLNTSNVIKLYIGTYVALSALTLVYKFIALSEADSAMKNVSLAQISVPMLQLIPSKTVYTPWTLITSTFVEPNPVLFILGAIGFYNGLNFLNKSWENSQVSFDKSLMHNEINRYLLFSIVLTNTITVLNYIVFSIAFGELDLLQDPINHGLLSILMCFVVVLKQLKPEFEIKIVRLRLKYLPFVIYLLSIITSLAFRTLTPFLPISNNFLVAWYYLRFIQKDYSSIFEFVSFFPDTIKPLVQAVFVTPISHLARFLGVVPAMIDANEAMVLPITSDVAERRRQVALKVLEERIGE